MRIILVLAALFACTLGYAQDRLKVKNSAFIDVKSLGANSSYYFFERDKEERRIRVEIIDSLFVANQQNRDSLAKSNPGLKRCFIGKPVAASTYTLIPVRDIEERREGVAYVNEQAAKRPEWNNKGHQGRTERYAVIRFNQTFMSSKVNAYLDTGDFVPMFSGKKFIKDKSGDVVEFNSIADGLNYMNFLGYEVLTVYITTFTSSLGVEEQRNFVLKKRLATPIATTQDLGR